MKRDPIKNVLHLQILVIGFERYGPNDGGAGIWAGLFFGIAGGLGILAAWRPTNCRYSAESNLNKSNRNDQECFFSFSSIIAFMVMNIIAAIMSGPMIIMNSVAFGSKTRARYWHNDDEDIDHIKENIIGKGMRPKEY